MKHGLKHSLLLAPLSALLSFASALLVSPFANAAVLSQHDWVYDPALHKLVSLNGDAAFSLRGGAAVTDNSGTPGVRFTTAPSLGIYALAGFVTPGAEDFTWTAAISVDKVYPKSSANVAQYGLWDGHQIKMQLDKYGVPQCVFNGTNGRIIVTASAYGTVNDGGNKHQFSCWRRGDTLGATVDGIVNTAAFAIGSITPTGKPTIGNKSASAGPTDQLFGTFWGLSVTIGS